MLQSTFSRPSNLAGISRRWLTLAFLKRVVAIPGIEKKMVEVSPAGGLWGTALL
jgi:hypothetical protein